MKSISTINPAIMENTKCLIVKTCIQLSIKIVGVSLDRSVPLHFISSYFKHFGKYSN